MTGEAVDPTSGGAAASGRSAARLAAVQALYEMDVSGAEPDAVLAEFLAKRWHLAARPDPEDGGGSPPEPAETEGTIEDANAEWLADLVQGVTTRTAELDRLIAGALSDGLALDRLESLLRAILRAGAFELSAKLGVPAAVVINEYMEVTHAFFEQREVALVNAVLDRLAGELRPGKG